MRLASSHGAFNRLTKSPWPRPRLATRFAHVGVNPVTRKSFKSLQLELDETPYWASPKQNPNDKDVAILGGGITGLAAAFELSRTMPEARITIYEAASKLGGWMDSEIVPVAGGDVVFEWGPRTLRHTGDGSGAATINLMANLGMGSDIVATSVLSPAARNRYIYYPDHLVRMPGPIPGKGVLSNLFTNAATIFTEPIFKGVISGMLAEPSVDPRPPHVEDESVGDFITRRFGKAIAENLVSAFLHGIYAGDLYKLSTRTLFPSIWHLETMDTGIVGSLGENMWNMQRLASYEQLNFQLSLPSPQPEALENILQRLAAASVYTFRRGLHQLITSLESALSNNPKVTIKTSTIAHSLHLDNESGSKTVNLKTQTAEGSDTPCKHDYLISTVSPFALATTLRAKSPLADATGSHPRLTAALLHAAPPTVNVMVINLFYSNPHLLSVSGFGYLLPRSVPLEQNPERALGVIFGSETSKGSVIVPARPRLEDMEKTLAMAHAMKVDQDTAPGTKLTVMLGGHWWESWSESDLPDEATAIDMAKAVLARQLGVRDKPVVAKAMLAKNAIPQYQVGYHRDMQQVHETLVGEFGGQLKVAGSWCQGAVGVNDCIRKATEVAWSVAGEMDERTGVERFGKEERWVVVERSGKVVKESLKGKQE